MLAVEVIFSCYPFEIYIKAQRNRKAKLFFSSFCFLFDIDLSLHTRPLPNSISLLLYLQKNFNRKNWFDFNRNRKKSKKFCRRRRKKKSRQASNGPTNETNEENDEKERQQKTTFQLPATLTLQLTIRSNSLNNKATKREKKNFHFVRSRTTRNKSSLKSVFESSQNKSCCNFNKFS
jgi:hypothetical protein